VRPLRLGEEKKEERKMKEEETTGGKYNGLPYCIGKGKVKAFHTRYRAFGPELIPVYRQSARR